MLSGNLCSLGNSVDESVHHLLLTCSRIDLVWKDVFSWFVGGATSRSVQIGALVVDPKIPLLLQLRNRFCGIMNPFFSSFGC